MCVVSAKFFKGQGWSLAKNRDTKCAKPNVEIKNGGRYMLDVNEGWVEGLNNSGIAIISSETDFDTRDVNSGILILDNQVSTRQIRDGRTMDAILSKATTVEEALEILLEAKMPGLTFITDGLECILVESGHDRLDFEEKKFIYKVIECNESTTYVRASHGIEVPVGHSANMKGDKRSRKVSESRMSAVLEALEDINTYEDMLDALDIRTNEDTQMNPVRFKKSKSDPVTTGQLLINPYSRVVTYRSVQS